MLDLLIILLDLLVIFSVYYFFGVEVAFILAIITIIVLEMNKFDRK